MYPIRNVTVHGTNGVIIQAQVKPIKLRQTDRQS